MNNIKIKLNDLQIDLIDKLLFSEESFIAVRAGWGSGKTSAIVFSLLSWAESHPGQSSLLITDTADRFRDVLLPEIDKWLIGPLGWVFEKTNSRFISPNGHIVWTRAYFRPDTRSSSHNPLEGLNITSGLALIDECQTLNEEVAHKALGRLRAGEKVKLVMVGLPVWSAWWTSFAERAGCNPIFYSSFVNKKNLGEDWFKAIEALPEAEKRAMVYNEPAPQTGLVYSEWGVNNVLSDWKYDPSMSGRIAIDFGFRKPSVLIIVHDPILEADVICEEINPQEIKLSDLAKLILEVACPRELSNQYPNRILIDYGCGDKAGNSRNDHTAITSFRQLSKPPEEGGIGVRFRFVTDPIRVDIVNGVSRTKHLIGNKKILCTKDVWEKGANSKGNSFRKAILSYAWDNREIPKKTGIEDPLDALRYDVINWNWKDKVINNSMPVLSSRPTALTPKPAPKSITFASNTKLSIKPIKMGGF